MKTDYLIIGGGIASISACENIRKQDKIGTIILVSEELHPPYNRLILSKQGFVFNKIPPENIFLRKESWYIENQIQILTGTVVNLNTQTQVVSLGNNIDIAYKKLLIANGLTPNKISAQDSDKNGVFYLRTLDDSKNIISAMARSQKAICLGGGFISFEMCHLLKLANIQTTVIIQEPYYWANILCKTAGKLMEKYLTDNNVMIINNDGVEKFIYAHDQLIGLETKNGKHIECDMVVIGVGASGQLEFIKSANIKTNRGILTNEYLQTNIHNIWAAGDCAEFYDVVLSENIQLGNWTNALMHGKIAGLNMAGQNEIFRQVSFYSTHGLGLNITFIGEIKITADKASIERQKNNTSYERLTIKNNKIIGAVLLNYQEDISKIVKLISEKINIENNLALLKDPKFDLQKLF